MKLKQGNYDAIILAAAGLKRLKVEEHFEEINIKTITPSPGQAVIAIVIKKKSELVSVLKKIIKKHLLSQIVKELIWRLWMDHVRRLLEL